MLAALSVPHLQAVQGPICRLYRELTKLPKAGLLITDLEGIHPPDPEGDHTPEIAQC